LRISPSPPSYAGCPVEKGASHPTSRTGVPQTVLKAQHLTEINHTSLSGIAAHPWLHGVVANCELGARLRTLTLSEPPARGPARIPHQWRGFALTSSLQGPNAVGLGGRREAIKRLRTGSGPTPRCGVPCPVLAGHPTPAEFRTIQGSLSTWHPVEGILLHADGLSTVTVGSRTGGFTWARPDCSQPVPPL
jgi:hypothetical protein